MEFLHVSRRSVRGFEFRRIGLFVRLVISVVSESTDVRFVVARLVSFLLFGNHSHAILFSWLFGHHWSLWIRIRRKSYELSCALV